MGSDLCLGDRASVSSYPYKRHRAALGQRIGKRPKHRSPAASFRIVRGA